MVLTGYAVGWEGQRVFRRDFIAVFMCANRLQAPGGLTLLGRLSEDGVGLGVAEGDGVCSGGTVLSGVGVALGCVGGPGSGAGVAVGSGEGDVWGDAAGVDSATGDAVAVGDGAGEAVGDGSVSGVGGDP